MPGTMDQQQMATDDIDEDEPPPLEDMTSHLAALHVQPRLPAKSRSTSINSSTKNLLEPMCTTTSLAGGKSIIDPIRIERLASATTSQGSGTGVDGPSRDEKRKKGGRAGSGLRAGFFNTPAGEARRKQEGPDGVVDLTHLKGSRGGGKQTQIPESLRVKVEEAPLGHLKQHLVEMMKPTPELLQSVMSNSSITSGLDDPEVMAAVAEVARDPAAMERHSHNPKVAQFYASMGKLMGDRLQKTEGRR